MPKYFGRKLNAVTVHRQELYDSYTPEYQCERKNNYFIRCRNMHRHVDGELEISRWVFNEDPFEEACDFPNNTIISTDPEYYNYKKDVSKKGRYVWYVNFADYNLFGFYDLDMFSQDEIQTLEHPLLAASLRMLTENHFAHMEPYTALSRNKVPSPYLVENVPYWISVNTSVVRRGVVHNLYGHDFITAKESIANAGVKNVSKEINDNIIAIAAPDNCHNQEYSVQDIKYIMTTLLSSFSAAVQQGKAKGNSTIVIHTGNWGCGAFGADPVLMYLTQFIAAAMIGVDELVFHAPMEEQFNKAKELFNEFKTNVVDAGKEEVRGKICSLKQIVDFLLNYKFKFGTSNGQ